ncbi:MAG: ROK family transcriptional regulator [Candidatus Promineofilum sp.]|nr:ROK family transcriptional regulator [Promineifilum sp.]
MQKATRHQTRDHNSRLVLKTIFNDGPISRAEIARRTRLTRPTVSTLAADLLDGDLVIETGRGPSAGGKRPTLLSINDAGPCVLTLDLSSDDYRAALVTLRGDVVRRAACSAAGLRGDEAQTCIYRLVDELLPTEALLGIGVATPGLVDPQRGVVLRAVNRGWIDLPLRELLAARYDRPVYVANDSHMAALAEYTYGAGPSGGNLIVVRVTQGIGAGVILSGRPFYGDGFGAGEIGHVVVDVGGALCSCGNRGCLETTSSIPAMLRAAKAADRRHSLLAGDAPLTWPRFIAAVAAHDPLAVDVAVCAGCHLGAAVAHLVGAYNIQSIVLAGDIAALGDVFLDAVQAEMHQRVLPAMAAATTVRYPSLDAAQVADITTLGAAALVMQRELGIL